MAVGERSDIWLGTLALMVLRRLQALEPLHGHGLARRIELTRAGQRQVKKAAAEWEQTTAIVARFLTPAEEA
jgi:PadR family transcriptional regulator, regulatory protein PadR